MAHESSPPVAAAPSRSRQAISGLMPPQLGEARIREEWPTILGINPGLASLARTLQQTVILAPLGWLIALPLFKLKLAPFLCRRYTLSNQRLMIRRGWKPVIVEQIPLGDIDDVRLDSQGVDPFYLSGNLEVLSKGQVVMRLAGVPEPEGFRHAILNARNAWVPAKATGPFQAASAVTIDGASAK